MSTRAGRTLALLAATAVVVSPAAPVRAEEPAGAELPAALDADLSPSETAALAGLTDGAGTRLSALVETADGAEVVTFEAASATAAENAVSLLEAQPSVQAADVAGTVRATAGALPQYGNGLVRSDAAREAVGAAISDVVVAVLDTGVGPHPELDAALLPGRNFSDSGDPLDSTDRHGHGTHVAGTIGADAGSQVEGVAAGVRILPVKVLGDTGSGYSTWVASGIVWAADNGADVINLSLGSSWGDDVEAAAVDYARAQGVTVVAAAGNWNVSEPFYPAAFPGVVGVSAVDDQRAKAGFSNFGAYVDVAGPGVDVLSTVPGEGYEYYSGTSMASPHVAGVAALATAAGPGLTPDQVERVLGGTATDLGDPGRDDVFGSGLVDAVRAVHAAQALDATGSWPGNAPPVAPDRTATSRYTPGNLRVDVLAGASDPDGDPLTLVGFTQGTHGSVRRVGAQLVWSPLRSGPFTDTFTYTVDDGWSGRATGTVTVTVGAPDPANQAPVAGADGVLVTHEMTEGAITYLLENDSDPDGDPLRIVAFTQPQLGTTSTGAEGLVEYTKPAGIWGTGVDSFRYTVTDDRGRFATATVLVDIRHPNSVPVANDDHVRMAEGAVSLDVFPAGNDTDADADDWKTVTDVGTAQHGDVTLLPGNRVRYTPSGDLPLGTTDSFAYTLSDGFWGTAQATVHVTVVEPAAPSAPALGALVPADGAAVVRWTSPADAGTSAISGYVVRAYRGGTLVRSVAATAGARSARLSGLVNGRAYTVRVAATNAAGTGPASAAGAVTPRTTPGAPGVGRADALRGAAVVRWQAPASNGGALIDGYTVRVSSGGRLVKAVAASRAARSLTVGGLAAGRAYVFRVLARNAAGTGAGSSFSNAVVPLR